jgi:NADPH:quinone reductase-like Zn-dependent oxidoreductase
MFAVYLTGHGGLDKLVVCGDALQPEPAPGEVLVKVGGCAVNNSDLWTREGLYGRDSDPDRKSGWRREPMRFPRIQGMDIAGRIEAVGTGVPDSRIGERVLVDHILYSDASDGLEGCEIIGSERDGGFADYVSVPSENALAVRSGYSDAELASFPTAYGTAESMLNRAGVTAGDVVLITGASGGVGSALIQLTKLRGALLIAVVGGGKEDMVKGLGADHVLLRGSNLEHGIASLRPKVRVNVVCDVVGGESFPELLEVLCHRGRYVTAGAIAGPMVNLDLRTVYLKYLTMIGSTMWRRTEFLDVVSHIESGRLKPLVWKTYGLRDIHEAQMDFQSKKFFGKLVLIPEH